MNKTMGHLHMRRQLLKPTRKKIADADIEDKFNTNVLLCTTVEPSTTQEGKKVL